MSKKIDRKEAMEEAIERMKLLGLAPEAISDFQKTGKVGSYMENGQCCPLDAAEQERIQEFEEEWGFLVYAAIRNKTAYGRMMCYIIVSAYKEDWFMEQRLMMQDSLLAYVYNYDAPYNSESGLIGIGRLPGGMLERTW